MKQQVFWKRLGFAWHGVLLAFKRENSFRTHALAAAAVLLLILVIRPAPVWCALLAIATGAVLVAELLNSALETLADHLHPELHPEIGAAKDMAAGAVLLASVFAVLVGLAFLVELLSGV